MALRTATVVWSYSGMDSGELYVTGTGITEIRKWLVDILAFLEQRGIITILEGAPSG